MKTSRTITVYVLLFAAWAIVGIWQMVEHERVKASARAALENRARDISYSLATVIRSQSWFGGVRQERLERTMEGLAQSDELISVALLNAMGDVVTSAGEHINLDMSALPERSIRWGKKAVTFVNPIDLGRVGEDDSTTGPPYILFPEREGRPGDRERGGRGGEGRGPDRPGGPDERDDGPDGRDGFRRPVRPTGQTYEKTSEATIVRTFFPPDTPTTVPVRRERTEPRNVRFEKTSDSVVMVAEYSPDVPTSGPGSVLWASRDRGEFRRRRPPRPFGRPPWMSEEDYQTLTQKQGLHGFVLVMTAEHYNTERARDLGLRLVMGAIALVAAIGLGLAWRVIERSARLQLRLVRASEMNAHLREMNVAAAGLAHETRNPLNIVRGMAQLISQQTDASPEIRKRSTEIIEEVDRVTGRLNEFIDYSKPREAKPTPTKLSDVVRDVERTLESDIEDKNIECVLEGPDLTVQADESLLRQVLFNLMLNSVQSVDKGGHVSVLVEKTEGNEARLEVRDNGPGVPESALDDIFRPYFTTHEGGTGLGLAVVRQIVLAHHWEIEYVSNTHQGACFRVSGIKLSARGN